ncbi:hypothetical protein [Algoriphagus sediminis]|uniref:WYL domain-containing protein n=1 Tax=Algoriphagus sediminis TaxID=3057113 RepID=A0ABT7YBA1_9BACT|nr:hypothetical protein [Algoriphagus sediminis]MDN3203773.1 hypothetical protein [Algoriphagus sediminis]
MKDTIIKAIENRNLLEFEYDGYSRTVEPHTLGVSKTGKETLSAYQTAGDSARGSVPCWGLFSLSKIEYLEILDDSFDGTRPGYSVGDSRMVRVIAEL